jgi:hypothetical protein
MKERKVKTARRKNIQYDEQLIITSQIYFFKKLKVFLKWN